MNRRDLFGLFVAGGSSLVLPYEPRRVYSFLSVPPDIVEANLLRHMIEQIKSGAGKRRIHGFDIVCRSHLREGKTWHALENRRRAEMKTEARVQLQRLEEWLKAHPDHEGELHSARKKLELQAFYYYEQCCEWPWEPMPFDQWVSTRILMEEYMIGHLHHELELHERFLELKYDLERDMPPPKGVDPL